MQARASWNNNGMVHGARQFHLKKLISQLRDSLSFSLTAAHARKMLDISTLWACLEK
jgi:hypothetical protein